MSERQTRSESSPERARKEARARSVTLSSLVDADFYDQLERYQPNEEFIKLLNHRLPDYWRISRGGVWHQVWPPKASLPVQGWKIHVSATPQNAEDILQCVAKVCVKKDASFKFASDRQMFVWMNSRLWPRQGAGKFITIYPNDETHFRALLKSLYARLRDYDGPYILSDKRYLDCRVLYYRYGGLIRRDSLDNEGRPIPVLVGSDGQDVPDVRTPYFSLPDWVRDPFPDDPTVDVTPSLKEGRYTILNSLAFSTVGGVYLARDNSTGQNVLIKEARPFTDADGEGSDAVRLRTKEWRLLQKLSNTGLVPQPLDLFWDWEHLFLVESYISDAITLRNFIPRESALLLIEPSDEQIIDYFTKVATIGSALSTAVQVCKC